MRLGPKFWIWPRWKKTEIHRNKWHRNLKNILGKNSYQGTVFFKNNIIILKRVLEKNSCPKSSCNRIKFPVSFCWSLLHCLKERENKAGKRVYLVRSCLWKKSDLAWGHLKTAPYNLIAAIKARTFSLQIFTGFFCSSRQWWGWRNSLCSFYPLTSWWWCLQGPHAEDNNLFIKALTLSVGWEEIRSHILTFDSCALQGQRKYKVSLYYLSRNT